MDEPVYDSDDPELPDPHPFGRRRPLRFGRFAFHSAFYPRRNYINDRGEFVSAKKPQRRPVTPPKGETEPPAGDPWVCRWCGHGEYWLTHPSEKFGRYKRCRRCCPPAPGAER